MTAYGAGLRASEVICLKISDIDSDRMGLRIGQGKGRKDRYSLLSDRLLLELRGYWLRYRPELWLFPGGRTHYLLRSILLAKHGIVPSTPPGIQRPRLRAHYKVDIVRAGRGLYTSLIYGRYNTFVTPFSC